MSDDTPELEPEPAEQFPVEASDEQAAVNKEEKARHREALEDDRLPLPSASSVVDEKGHPDPLTQWSLERDPLEPLIESDVVAPSEDERQVDEATGRVESDEDRERRLVAAEKAAKARRDKRKDEAGSGIARAEPVNEASAAAKAKPRRARKTATKKKGS